MMAVHGDSRPVRWGRRLLKLGMAGVAAVVLAASVCGAWALWLHVSGNLHMVEPGVYRSAQPDAADIAARGRDLHLKTILNLRGAHPGTGWYDAESKAAAGVGARLINIALSANREPDAAALAVLIETLRTAEKPLLIHCYSGSDRAGLASALYELIVAHRTPSVSDRQLSFWFGHFPWLSSRSGAMDRTFDRVSTSLP